MYAYVRAAAPLHAALSKLCINIAYIFSVSKKHVNFCVKNLPNKITPGVDKSAVINFVKTCGIWSGTTWTRILQLESVRKAAIEKEFNKLNDRNFVDWDSVMELDEAKDLAAEKGETHHFGDLMLLCHEKHVELFRPEHLK